MTTSEMALLHSLWNAAQLEYRPTGRDTLEMLTHECERYPNRFIGAFDNDRLVGSIVVTDDGRRGWINRLAVHPDFRRTGLGQRLIRAGEEQLRGNGMRIIAALIEDDNTASLRTFEKAGYVPMPEVVYYSKRESQDV